jgi:sialate O-acetylesterase
VAASLAGHTVRAVAGAKGAFSITLPALAAGGPHTLTVRGKNTLTFTDVWAGEVWVGSGQSNMEFPLTRAFSAAEAATGCAGLHLFTVPRETAALPRPDVDGAWSPCTEAGASAFSAVAFHFGQELQAALGVHVGLIHTSWGGTPAEAWTRRDALAEDPALQPLLAQYRRIEGEYPSQRYGYERRLPIWNDALKAWQAANPAATPMPGMPAPRGGPEDPHRPASLWNAMIAPITPFAIRGVLWYQGETNALRAWDYQRLMTAMIQDWRRAWNRGDLPFLFVQLANFRQNPPHPGATWWAEVREAQRLTLGLPNTAMASAIDIGNPLDIHPLNKQEVGRRLALAARAVAYGDRVEYSGPLYDGMTIEGNRIRVRFRHAGAGLALDTAKGSSFVVAGVDGQFKPATAVVDGDTIVVSSPAVAAPVAVRYAWEDDPITSLRNKDGLPASPFRTDTF